MQEHAISSDMDRLWQENCCKFCISSMRSFQVRMRSEVWFVFIWNIQLAGKKQIKSPLDKLKETRKAFLTCNLSTKLDNSSVCFCKKYKCLFHVVLCFLFLLLQKLGLRANSKRCPELNIPSFLWEVYVFDGPFMFTTCDPDLVRNACTKSHTFCVLFCCFFVVVVFLLSSLKILCYYPAICICNPLAFTSQQSLLNMLRTCDDNILAYR